MKLGSEAGQPGGRLILCVVVAAGLVYAAEHFCPGREIPLWEKYGPWLLEHKLKAISLLAAGLYALSLVLFPLDSEGRDYEPC